MICLEEKGLTQYGSNQLSFLKYEHKSDHVYQINPRGQLPTFKHNDVILNESLGICHYLEDTFSEKGVKLLPDNPKEKALVLQRIYEALNLHSKCNEKILYYLLFSPPGEINKDVLNVNRKELIAELQLWESYLEKHEGEFFITGSNFTLADTVFFPQLAFVVRMYSDMSTKFPLLADYYKRLSSRKSIQETWPPHWKEVDGQNLLDEDFDPSQFDATRFIG